MPQTLLAAYRVGDSPVNVLAPLMVYLPFMVTVASSGTKRTPASAPSSPHGAPYAMWILITWTVLYLKSCSAFRGGRAHRCTCPEPFMYLPITR